MLLLLVPLAIATLQAADFFARPPKISEEFSRFINHLEGDSPVDAAYDQVTPAWMKYLREVAPSNSEVLPVLDDPDFISALKKLGQESRKKVGDYLKDMRGKIIATLNHAREQLSSGMLDEWYEGLKNFALSLAKNEAHYPALLDQWKEYRGKGIHHETLALLLGLRTTLDHGQSIDTVRFKYPDNLKLIMGMSNLKLIKATQLSLSINVAKLIHLSEHLLPSETALEQLLPNLTMISASAHLQYFDGRDIFEKAMELVPVGHRMVVGLLSQTKQSAILDFIKTPQFAYGVKYTTTKAFHSPIMAFCAPIEKFPKLINSLLADVNSWGSHHIVTQAIDLKWYGKPKKALDMVLAYAHGWPLGHRLALGLLWHICGSLSEGEIFFAKDHLYDWLDVLKLVPNKLMKILLERADELPRDYNGQLQRMLDYIRAHLSEQ